MASATITFSEFRPNVNVVHTGVNVTGGSLSTSAALTTICPSTVMHMCRVPSGATLLDFWLRIQTGGASQTVQIGTSGSPSGIMSITTLSQTYSVSASSQLVVPSPYGVFDQGWLRAPGGTRAATGATTNLMPVHISLSDDVQPRTVWVQGNLGAGVSASAFFTFLLYFTTDGLPGHTTIR